MFNKISKNFHYGTHQVVMETGELARQASGAVKISMDDTVLLVTVVADKNIKEGQDFFPLTVDYFERAYAGGKIPGSFLLATANFATSSLSARSCSFRRYRPLLLCCSAATFLGSTDSC